MKHITKHSSKTLSVFTRENGTVPNFFCLRLHWHPGTVPEIASEEGEHAQIPISSLLARSHVVPPVYT